MKNKWLILSVLFSVIGLSAAERQNCVASSLLSNKLLCVLDIDTQNPAYAHITEDQKKELREVQSLLKQKDGVMISVYNAVMRVIDLDFKPLTNSQTRLDSNAILHWDDLGESEEFTTIKDCASPEAKRKYSLTPPSTNTVASVPSTQGSNDDEESPVLPPRSQEMDYSGTTVAPGNDNDYSHHDNDAGSDTVSVRSDNSVTPPAPTAKWYQSKLIKVGGPVVVVAAAAGMMIKNGVPFRKKATDETAEFENELEDDVA